MYRTLAFDEDSQVQPIFAIDTVRKSEVEMFDGHKTSRRTILICSIILISLTGLLATWVFVAKPHFYPSLHLAHRSDDNIDEKQGDYPSGAEFTNIKSWHYHQQRRHRRSIEDSLLLPANSTKDPFTYKVIKGANNSDMPYNVTRLPDHLIPEEYALHFDIDLDKDNFTGQAKIKLHCETATDKIMFHGRRLHPTNITVFSGRTEIHIKKVTYVKSHEIFVVELKSRLEEQSVYEMVVDFTVGFGGSLAGLYKSLYKDFGEDKAMVSSHFEPTDARSAFPCLDEPFFKAVFHISITHATNLTALSNMPVKESTTIVGDASRNVTVFEPTVKMSTYLVAFSVNDFQYKEAYTPTNIKVRVYARAEDQARIEYAVEAAAKIIHFYGKFFNISYPLPKLDLLAVPEFMAGAMEDWGLVSFRSAYIVYDEKLSTIEQKRQVTLVIAHELAHQWFGNLVTMKWWNDIWLNEGFANFVELLGTDEVNPLFHSLDLEIPQGWQGALSLDSMKSTHPVMQEAEKPSEIDELFDAISYNKGAALLRMVQGFMKDELEQGVINYLNKYRYSNAQTDDLWMSLSLISKLNISKIMDSWVNRRSFPIVTVERVNKTSFRLRQESFLAAKSAIQNELSGNSTAQRMTSYQNITATPNATITENSTLLSHNNTKQPGEKVKRSEEGTSSKQKNVTTDETLWFIPFTYVTNINDTETLLWFDQKETVIRVPEETTWLKGNIQVNGYYIVNYDNATWREIIQQLKVKNTVLSANDKGGLIHDAFKLACERMVEPTVPLDLVRYMTKEDGLIPFSMLRSKSECLSTTLQDKKVKAKYMKYIWYLQSNLIIPQMIKDRSNVSRMTPFERMQRYETMSYGLKFNLSSGLRNETRDVFKSLISNDESASDISPENRALALMYGFNPNETEHLNYLWKLFMESPLDSDRRILMRSISQFKEQINITLERSMNTTITRVQDQISLLASLVRNGLRKEVWNFVVKNFDTLHKRYGGGYQMGQLLSEVAGGFTSEDMYKKVETFLDQHKFGGWRTSSLILEKIRTNVNRHSNSTVNANVAKQINAWLENENIRAVSKRAVIKLIG